MANVGDVYQVSTNRISIKVASGDNGGEVAMWLTDAPPGSGVPLHVHWDAAETIFVRKGRFKIRLGDELIEVGPGDGMHLPANVPDAYKNFGEEPGQLIFTVMPGGVEGFFEEISHRSELQAPKDLPVINEIAAKYQFEIIGPQIA